MPIWRTNSSRIIKNLNSNNKYNSSILINSLINNRLISNSTSIKSIKEDESNVIKPIRNTKEMIFRTRDGKIKVNLAAKHTVGVETSRGERPYQEDTYAVESILVSRASLKKNINHIKGAGGAGGGAGWSPTSLEGYVGEESGEGGKPKRQVAFFGVYDGHGGAEVSKRLQESLHTKIENALPDTIPKTIKDYRALGGYLRRYQGGPLLTRYRDPITEENKRRMGLHEMCVLAFLQTDLEVLADPTTGNSGSTATIALLHSLDIPHSLPFYASSLLSLTIAHLGDTRAILASVSGRAVALTENHHPDSRVESERLRQSGTGILTDSFGESRFGGTLANTRGLGDRQAKSLGVFGEPEVSTRILQGDDWAFLVLLTDGVTNSISDGEIVDLARGISDPTVAAKTIVKFAEDVGSDDNLTCIIVPLPGWGKMKGVDSSASRREYRLKQKSNLSGRQRRM